MVGEAGNARYCYGKTVMVEVCRFLAGSVLFGCHAKNEDRQGDAQTNGAMSTNSLEPSNAEILAFDRPFRLEVYIGNPLQGFDVILVESAGIGRSISRERILGPAIPPYRSVEFKLLPEQVAGVRRRLVESRFLSLRSVYRDPSLADGTHVLMRLTVGELHKTVCCYNQTPDAVQMLLTHLQSEVVEPARQAPAAPLNEVPIQDTMPPFACEQ